MIEFGIKAPRIPASLPDWEGEVGTVTRGWQDSGVRILGKDFSGVVASSSALDQVRLERLTLDAANFTSTRLWDVALVKCGCAGVNLSNSALHCCAFNGCRTSGINLSEAQLEHVRFEACKMDQANFRSAKLENVEFIECDMRGVDFAGATLTRVRFVKCNLAGGDFDRSALNTVDLRTSEIGELKSASGLSGATISSLQLLEIADKLAFKLGVLVSDEK